MKTCFSLPEWLEYSTLRLPQKELQRMENHLESCTRCKRLLEFLQALNDSRAGFYSQPHYEEIPCPEPETLAALAENRLGEAERTEVFRHLSLCQTCTGEYADLQDLLEKVSEQQDHIPENLLKAARDVEPLSVKEETFQTVEQGSPDSSGFPCPKTKSKVFTWGFQWSYALAAAILICVLLYSIHFFETGIKGVPELKPKEKPSVQTEESEWSHLSFTGTAPHGPMVLSVRLHAEDPVFQLILTSSENLVGAGSKPAPLKDSATSELSRILNERYGISAQVKKILGVTLAASEILSASPPSDIPLWVKINMEGILWVDIEEK